jgi:hypothetical protein
MHTVTINADDLSRVCESITVGSKRKNKDSKRSLVNADEEILDSDEFKKFEKHFDAEYIELFLNKSTEELKEAIAHSTVEIKNESDIVQNEPNYVKMKEDLKLLNSALNEVLKPLKDTVKMETFLINYRE